MTGSLRNSLIQPPAEAWKIVDLFSDAADALMDGDRNRANKLIAKANQPWISKHLKRAWSEYNRETHPYKWNADYKSRKLLPKNQCDRRTPLAAMQHEMFKRDAWHCRYCGIPVIDGHDAFEKLKLHAQGLSAWQWGSKNAQQHPGAALIRGVPEHVKPWSAGGPTNLENLVTACWPCNGAKYNALLEEAGLTDPRKRSPVKHRNWDGLRRLLQLPKPPRKR